MLTRPESRPSFTPASELGGTIQTFDSGRIRLAGKTTFIILLSFCWGLVYCHAGTAPLEGDLALPRLAHAPAIELYEDKTGLETIESVRSKDFRPSKQLVPNFGHTRSVYWLKLSKKNPDTQQRIFYLQIENQWLDHVDFFVGSSDQSSFQSYPAGALLPSGRKMLGDRGPVLKLQFAPLETKTVFVRVQSRTAVRVPIFLASETAYEHARMHTFFMLGIFYGIVGFLIVYNIFAWSILKQSAYLYYILLLTSAGIFQLAWDDLIPRISLFGHPENMLHLCTSAFALVRICNILFVASFMDVRSKYPILYRFLDFLLIISIVLAIVYLVNFYVGNYLMMIFTPFLAFTLTGILGLMWYRGETHARYLFLAHLPFPAIALVGASFLVGIVPFHPVLFQLIKVAYVWQGIFFTLALADRFAVMQRSFRNILEGTVAKRSEELVAANRELQREIRERMRTENELRQAKDAAESAARARTQFLANMSHEIRTPISGVIGMSELALSTHLNPEQHEYLEAINISADSLLKIINDVLDFSKLEAGRLEVLHIDFSLRSTVADTMAMMAFQAHAKNLELVYHVRPEVPEAVVGDPGRLRQVLVNLVGNAIKFTEKGEVTVNVELETEEPQETRLHCRVSDTGIGDSGGHAGEGV